MKRLLLMATFCVVLTVLVSSCQQNQNNRLEQSGQHSIKVGNRQRSYYLHVPPSYDKNKPMPLVLVFHGGGGNGKGMEGITGFSTLADQKGFIVVYPDGVDRRWRSQPETTPEDRQVNDVGFISTLIDNLSQTFSIDRKRVYAAGMSNGGVFSHRLGCELSNKIPAIAAVAGTLSAKEAQHCTPIEAVSVIQFHGMNDGIIPYNGGVVRSFSNTEEVLSVADTTAFWRRINRCSTTAQRAQVPDINPSDETKAELVDINQCETNAEVVLYMIGGGGHTWPGGSQYLPDKLIGKTNRDLNATQAIWDFFTRHSKP